MAAGVYRALPWGVAGSGLMVVAKAARSSCGGHPEFAMIEGQKVMNLATARVGGVEKWSPVTKSRELFTEAMYLEEVN